MYRIGICDDDKALCAVLEEDILAITKDLKIESETEVWYSGEGIEKDLQNGQQLDLLFLDIELAEKDDCICQAIRRLECVCREDSAGIFLWLPLGNSGPGLCGLDTEPLCGIDCSICTVRNIVACDE